MAQPPEDAPGVEPLFRRAWETGRHRWPQVDLPADAFIRHLSQVLPEARSESSLDSLIEHLELGDLYLACACLNGMPTAIELLELHYVAKLPSLLGYLKLSTAMMDEVCQRVRTHLLVRTPGIKLLLAEYTGRGTLLGWIRVIAVRKALRLGATVRETPVENVYAAFAAVPASGLDAELELIKRRYRHEFRQAVHEAFTTLSSKQRYLLRLHFIHRLPTTKMAALFSKDQSTISRWLKDAREKVYAETKSHLQERLRLSSQEFESLMSAIQSGFDISLSESLNDEGEREGSS